MSLFEMDFLKKMEALLKEAFKFKKYKAMSPVLAVFTGILMLPLVIASFAATAVFALLGFAFVVLSAPVRYLHDILHNEGQRIKHASQAVVYLLSWSIVFFFYILMSILMLLILPIYAILSILLYVWSLGGFKFHLFPNESDDISIEVKGTYRILPSVFILVGGVLLLLIPAIQGTIHFADLYANYQESQFLSDLGRYYLDYYLPAHTVFALLYSLIGFAQHPKSKVAKANIEDVQVEEMK